MKKAVFLSITLLLLLVFAAVASAAPTVILNGQEILFDVPPVIQDGTTLVPLRAIFEPLGADVRWEPQTGTVTVYKEDKEIKLVISRTDAYVNDTTVTLPVPVQSIDGRTMVPLRFLSTALGCDVRWDPDSQIITISGEVSTTPGLKSAARVHFIDVGQGDAIYIQLPQHVDILIDGGNLDAEGTVINYLKDQGVDDLELLIATCPDEHHIGALPAVIGEFAVERVIDCGLAADASDHPYYCRAVQSENCPWEAADHQSLSFGDATLQILSGQQDWADKKNRSVISRLSVDDIHFLFTSDAKRPAEEALKGEISAQVLKVGDHGGPDSTSSGFLTLVKPEVAIISLVGDNPRWYGHDSPVQPAPEVLEGLKNIGARVFRTDLNGTITIVTDGIEYSVTSSGPPLP